MKRQTQKKKKPVNKKAASQPVIAPQSNSPPTPKLRDMRKIYLLRIFLWTVLGFVFLRGLLSIIFPSDTSRMVEQLTSNLSSVASEVKTTNEMSAFAESFAREYFTYSPHGGDDYRQRLSRYCSAKLTSEICEGQNLRGGAAAIYTAALKVEAYTERQHDITVQAEVNYVAGVPAVVDGKEVLKDEIQTCTVYLTVPVYASPYGGYLVEDIPLITAAPEQALDYVQQDYTGSLADDRIKSAANTMLADFFKTLYSEEQRRIDYYLTEDADRTRLQEMKSNITFSKVDSFQVYATSAPNSYTCIVSLRLEDKSGTNIRQRLTLALVENGSRLYVKSVDPRTHNLKTMEGNV